MWVVQLLPLRSNSTQAFQAESRKHCGRMGGKVAIRLTRLNAFTKYTDSISYHVGPIDSPPVNHIGKPDAGDPHVRFDEGDWTLAVQSLLY